MSETAEIKYGEQTLSVPVITGSEQERGLDIGALRAKTGLVTLDPAFMNTASTKSAITFIDGDKGILRYRGIDIAELAEKSTFLETAYLLLNGKLPNAAELARWEGLVAEQNAVHDGAKTLLDGFAPGAHPMAKLSAMLCTLSGYYGDELDPDNKEHLERNAARLISQVRTIAALSYRKSAGKPYVSPDAKASYCGDFLRMMFGQPGEAYAVDPEIEKVLNLLFILHADHEQNCSTSTVRVVGSARANLYASVAAGVCALWGPLHGGANQEVLEMLELIQKDGGDVAKYVALAKDKNASFRLMGFGHRVYKNFDPRAKIIKKAADTVLKKLNINDPLLEIAMKLEEAALKDEYFVQRKLYPNVDFYSGIIYRALGFPTDMFTVLFAIGRMPGWIAHCKELLEDSSTKIARPRQIYTGPTLTAYTPIDQRG